MIVDGDRPVSSLNAVTQDLARKINAADLSAALILGFNAKLP